jgi:hypothetical protein
MPPSFSFPPCPPPFRHDPLPPISSPRRRWAGGGRGIGRARHEPSARPPRARDLKKACLFLPQKPCPALGFLRGNSRTIVS